MTNSKHAHLKSQLRMCSHVLKFTAHASLSITFGDVFLLFVDFICCIPICYNSYSNNSEMFTLSNRWPWSKFL